MIGFPRRREHYIINVTDTDGDERNICACQLKRKHIDDETRVEFPVYECPEMTRKYGFGTEEGLQ